MNQAGPGTEATGPAEALVTEPSPAEVTLLRRISARLERIRLQPQPRQELT